MKARLLLLLWVVAAAGCGGSDEADARARAAEQARQRQERLEQETEKALASAPDLDDIQKQLVPDKPEKKPASRPAPAAGDEDEGPLRTWTDPAGSVLARAEFVSILEGKVCLQKEDGSAAVIPLDELSQKDRDYVKRQAGEDALEAEARGDLVAQADVVVEEGGDGAPAARPIGMESEEVAEPDPARQDYPTARRRKVVIPFDFVSMFDEGRYGQMVGDMVWKKLEREGGFVIPESMYDVRDFCAANNRQITPDTPLGQMAEVVRKDFDADVGIWGSVERAPGAEWEIYDLVIKCVDFSQPEPEVVYQIAARTNSVSEIPHLYVQQMLDKLYDRQPGGPPPLNQLAEENWKNNPNMVEGGDFQKGAGGVPAGWESGGGQFREPLGGLVKWIPEPGNEQNKVIRFTFDQGVGDGYGVMYYSKPFPVDEGATYRFQCRWRSNGPNVKVFIKCYDQMASQYTPDAAPRPAGRRGSYVPEASQLRECYRSQQNLYGPKNTWNVHTQDFTPKHTKYTPRWGKVMLYAYLGAGVVEFDDVVLKQIVPASPGESIKDRRHSMESDVTLKEMEENERRAAEARERMRQGAEP